MAAIFIHGAGGGAFEWAIWAGVFTALGVRHRAVELEPVVPLENTRLADYRRQLAEAIREPVVLVGASLGGLLALSVLDEPSLDVRGLVLVNPMPPAGLPPSKPYPPVIPWGRDASLAGTRRAMPDAADATCLAAFRAWRDESRAVLDEARAGIAWPSRQVPSLSFASELDDDVPAPSTRALAVALGGSFVEVPGASHVGPLLGRSAAGCAELAARWMSERLQIRA